MVTSAFLVRPSRGDLFRSDVAAYGIRVRTEMMPLMAGAAQGAVSGGAAPEGEPWSDGLFWDDDPAGWAND